MIRKDIIGDWGTDLSDTKYGWALAALGALEASGTQQHRASSNPAALLGALRQEVEEGERTLVWRSAMNVSKSTTPESRWKTIYKDAEAVANAWQLLVKSADHPRLKPRLAIEAAWRLRPDLFDFDTLLGWLGRMDNGCQALMLASEDASADCRTLWHWPLRIGIPAGPDGESLISSLRGIRHGWIERLTKLQLVGEAREACDLLILPPGTAAKLAEQSRLRLRASFVVCLDAPVRWSESAETVQARLRTKLGAAGVGLVGHPNRVRLNYWYEWLVRELSHDLPVHAAIWGVGVYRTGVTPVVVGNPRALDHLRILAIAKSIDSKLGQLLPRGLLFVERGFLTDRVRKRLFEAETIDGIPIAEAIAEGNAKIEEKRQPRWIQARIWRQDLGAEHSAQTLAPRQPSLLEVFIGPSKQPQLGAVFPDGIIDYNTGEVNVSVQIELSGAALKALPKRIQGDADASLISLPDMLSRLTSLVRPWPKMGNASVGCGAEDPSRFLAACRSPDKRVREPISRSDRGCSYSSLPYGPSSFFSSKLSGTGSAQYSPSIPPFSIMAMARKYSSSRVLSVSRP